MNQKKIKSYLNTYEKLYGKQKEVRNFLNQLNGGNNNEFKELETVILYNIQNDTNNYNGQRALIMAMPNENGRYKVFVVDRNKVVYITGDYLKKIEPELKEPEPKEPKEPSTTEIKEKQEEQEEQDSCIIL